MSHKENVGGIHMDLLAFAPKTEDINIFIFSFFWGILDS